jgi:hypothetical protein
LAYLFSHFPDDLPVIKENVRKGFLETQSKVNKWITDFKKRIDGEDDEDEDSYSRPAASTRGGSQFPIRRSSEGVRRSNDRDRYDPDPQALDDDFTTLELRDDEGKLDSPQIPSAYAYNSTTAAPPKPPRPAAHPDLNKPTPRAPLSGPIDELDALYQAPAGQPNSGNKARKWQPLTSTAPNPEVEDDRDPFSLGDSDEDDAKQKDLRAEDTERLKKAAADAGKDGEGVDKGSGELKPAERSGSLGTRDKEAEEILKS